MSIGFVSILAISYCFKGFLIVEIKDINRITYYTQCLCIRTLFGFCDSMYIKFLILCHVPKGLCYAVPQLTFVYRHLFTITE